MGEVRAQRPVLLIVGVSSKYDDAFAWSRKEMERLWGPVCLESERFTFSETNYYSKTMGSPLEKQFFGFENLIDPAEIAAIKIATNELEQSYDQQFDRPVERPLNLDPGYLTEAKLVLATTKDRDHRIYLQQGIFAEVTLYFQQNQWQFSRWTCPDYRRDDFKAFFDQCRAWLRKRYQSTANPTVDKSGKTAN